MISTNTTADRNSVRERPAQHTAPSGDAEAVDRARLQRAFRERAERLARRGREETIYKQKTPVLVFRLGSERFGIELFHVKQVFPHVAVTSMPGTSAVLIGVANLNGSLRSVVDLAALLNVAAVRSDAAYVVLLRSCDRRLGVSAETLEGVCHVDLEGLEPLDEAADHAGGGVVRGTTDDHVLVLDAESLIEAVAERRRREVAEQ